MDTPPKQVRIPPLEPTSHRNTQRRRNLTDYIAPHSQRADARGSLLDAKHTTRRNIHSAWGALHLSTANGKEELYPYLVY